MRSKMYGVLIIALLIMAGVFAVRGWFEKDTPSVNVSEIPPPPPPEPDPQPTPLKDVSVEVEVFEPQPNAVVSSPLRVRGHARGFWYFEANLPVSVLDTNKKVIARVGAQSKGEWMTEDFVEFEVDIPFPVPDTPTGFLLVENDNPSGLSENAKILLIPIKFEDVSE